MSTPLSWLGGATDEDILAASGIAYITPHIWLKLQSNFSSLVAVLKATKSQLVTAGLTNAQADLFIRRPSSDAQAKKLLETKSIRLLRLGEKNYPKLLAEITDPPLWLFYRGDLSGLSKKSITIVGSRKVSQYALDAMTYVLDENVLRDVTVLSGLAYGVDKRAHQLSLKAGGTTVAVLAGGLDAIYPPAHFQLAETIIERGGALISEYPPLSRPEPYRFPIRNRILAGLSPLTVVVEAALKSGTLTTAKAALDYNRDLMAIPGEINSERSGGNNFLLKHGAGLLDSPTDLRSYYNIKSSRPDLLVDNHLLGTLDLVATGSGAVDQIVAKSGQSVETVLSALTQLELLGLVRQQTPGQYIKTK